MITIDRSGPDGNVFAILGVAKSFQRQIKKATGNENEVLADVLKNFTSMDYDGICAKLESTGLFKFTDGNSDDDFDENVDETGDVCPECGDEIWNGVCSC